MPSHWSHNDKIASLFSFNPAPNFILSENGLRNIQHSNLFCFLTLFLGRFFWTSSYGPNKNKVHLGGRGDGQNKVPVSPLSPKETQAHLTSFRSFQVMEIEISLHYYKYLVMYRIHGHDLSPSSQDAHMVQRSFSFFLLLFFSLNWCFLLSFFLLISFS